MTKKRVAGKISPARAAHERRQDGVSFAYDWDVYAPYDRLRHRALLAREGFPPGGMLTARARRKK